MAETMSEYLFVYGTLMSGMPAAEMLTGAARLVGRGLVRGALYDLGKYPALRPGDGDVWGEVYAVAGAATLRRIDAYEGYDPSRPRSLFRRGRVDVRLEDGSVIKAWAYFYALPFPPGARRIASGDYRLEALGGRT